MGYAIGSIRLIELRKERYEKERARLLGHELDIAIIWSVIAAADDLSEEIGLAR